MVCYAFKCIKQLSSGVREQGGQFCFDRAGRKLEAALEQFGIDVRGLNVLDSGISTGGFTDCLLQRGAASVIGVDVGYGQVYKLLTLHKWS